MDFPVTEHPHLLHALFEALAISIGALYYRVLYKRQHRQQSPVQGKHFMVLLGCIFGAALGNKIVFWLEMPHLFSHYWSSGALWFAGQSIVGGLLGGLIGVELAKYFVGIRHSTGDLFVFPLLLGLIIGRIGCFLAGLEDGTYGLPTEKAWGIDLGDGIPRHPTALYEIVFALCLWLMLGYIRPLITQYAGLLFRLFLSAYLLWRLLVEQLKPLPFDYGWGLSGIQVVCLLALCIYVPLSLRAVRTAS